MKKNYAKLGGASRPNSELFCAVKIRAVSSCINLIHWLLYVEENKAKIQIKRRKKPGQSGRLNVAESKMIPKGPRGHKRSPYPLNILTADWNSCTKGVPFLDICTHIHMLRPILGIGFRRLLSRDYVFTV